MSNELGKQKVNNKLWELLNWRFPLLVGANVVCLAVLSVVVVAHCL